MERVFGEATTDAQRISLAEELELDFAYQANGIGRFRVNAYLQGCTISLACRPIQTQLPIIDELGLPEVCKSLVLKPRGLIVVTGPAGCGKSTTLAAMMNYLNNQEKCKVVTIEDPIEFVHQDEKCVFSQRELGEDTRSFANALKHVLRQDPNVILVGEMRDLETMSAALTAAETGHLVLTTLHTPSAAQAIDRFIDIFPPHHQHQVRVQLATSAVRNLIREGKTYQLVNAIQTGSQYGMQTLAQALLAIYRNGIISRAEALARSVDVEELKEMLGESH